MITTESYKTGERVVTKSTASKIASEIIDNALDACFYWEEKQFWLTDDMTEEEISKINQRLNKRVNSLLKKIGRS